MTLVRQLMTNWKMTITDDCADLHAAPAAFRQMLALPLPTELPALEIKQTFVSTNLACLLAF